MATTYGYARGATRVIEGAHGDAGDMTEEERERRKKAGEGEESGEGSS